jgi:hypothetical protein
MIKGGILSEKKTYKSGATRSADVEGVRYDLVPAEGVEAVARAMYEGAINHGDHNWKKGLKHSVYVNHALRHINLFMQGKSDEDHIGHALANLMMLVWNDKHLPEFNDLGMDNWEDVVEGFNYAVNAPPTKRPVGRPRKSVQSIANMEANRHE